MSRRRPSTPADLLSDPEVLEPVATLEVFGRTAADAVGGIAILPHRGEWLRARDRGVEALGWFDDRDDARFDQAVVHLQKGRAATRQGLAEAWRRLAPNGRLLFVGANELGVKSAVKRLAAELGDEPQIIANRARARVAAWRRRDASGPAAPEAGTIELETAVGRVRLATAPGVFSADEVDPGSALLLEQLDTIDQPSLVFDAGCGAGVLGLAALLRWPGAEALLADVDQRAVSCAVANADALAVADRCRVTWWDAVIEPPPDGHFDLALVNPPFHTGVPVDLQPARAIFRAFGAVLGRGGRALVVANRTLPWEHDLRELGSLRQLVDRNGYKVLELGR